MNDRKLKVWELALLLALCFTLCAGAWAQGAAGSVSGKLVRLHIVADSDSEAAQEQKARVRDCVLNYLTPLLEGVTEQAEATELIRRNLDGVRTAAEAVAGSAVTVTLCRESFPTRYYDGFALPAGVYTSLRVRIGEASGHNWWCVVFPTLCGGAAPELSLEAAGLTRGEIALVSEDGGYEIRFRLLELFGTITS